MSEATRPRATPKTAPRVRGDAPRRRGGVARARGEVPPAPAVADTFRNVNSASPVRAAVPATLLTKRRERAQQRIIDALEAAGTTRLTKAVAAEIQALARAWAEQGFDDRFDDAAKFEQRWFEEAEIARARKAANGSDLLAALETKHRAAVVRDFGKIEIRGLQMSARVYQDLDVAYVPLWVQDDSQEPEVIKAGEGMEIRAIPRLTVPELLAKHERAVLVGAPGAGKTTIVAYVAAQAANGQLHKLTGWQESPVPFVVAVRSLAESRLDVETIAEAANVDVELVRHAVRERRALVLVDGLDEAREGPSKLIAAVQAFVTANPGNRILVTTRPAATSGGEQVRIPGFATTTLHAMTREEVYQFIDRWCEAAERSIQKDPSKAREDAQRAAEDLKARVQASRPVERLAQTPLICSVLCIVHRFLGQRIPERRAALYETCTNVLLYEWDRAKFPTGAKIGQLDAHEKKLLLGGLARWMHEERVAEVAREEVVRQFGERLPWVNRDAAEAEGIVREIQDRSGILVERRPGFYGFSHLTFQEYLAAAEVVRVGETAKLAEKHMDRWWHEVTVLAAGLAGANAAGLIERLLMADSKREKPSAAAMLAAQCAETAIDLPVTLRQEVEARIAVLVPPRSDGDVGKLVELGEVTAPLLLHALGDPDPIKRGLAALTLGRLQYEPACGALAKMLCDGQQLPRPVGNVSRSVFTFWLGSFRFLAEFPSVAVCAADALFSVSSGSALARATLERAIPHAPVHAFMHYALAFDFLRHAKALRPDLGAGGWTYLSYLMRVIKAEHPETTSSRRAARSG
jgi:hypothetical protein